jgi:hypothetical protein
MLTVALCLSAVAAFYSIIGLTAIFAAAVVPIVIMGSILEAAKLVVTVWLHEYWREVKLSMKVYLVPAVFTLMVITSMGIFGFLSKAHLDQTVPTGDVQAQVALIDEKINNERDTIANARTLLGQLDKAVTDIGNTPDREVNGKTVSSAERALQVRRQQARDRAALTKTIEDSQARIVKLQEEKAPFAKELRKVEAEVGPIKYIAALIYGDNPDANLLEKAVRWVIIILVVVFDPLAIMMLLAATESYKWERQRKSIGESDNAHNNDTNIPKVIDDNAVVDHDRSDQLEPTILEPVPDPGAQSGPILEVIEPASVEAEPVTVADTTNIDATDIDHEEEVSSVMKQAMHLWKLDNPGDTLKEQRRLLEAEQIAYLPWEDYLDDPRIVHDVAFGKELPKTANRGDQFVLTDHLPTRLFKFNGETWIEVDKSLSDNYAYNQAYIDLLISRIGTGEYDPELLTDGERNQIEERLRQNIQ